MDVESKRTVQYKKKSMKNHIISRSVSAALYRAVHLLHQLLRGSPILTAHSGDIKQV